MNRMTFKTLRAQMALRGHSMTSLYNTFLRKMRCDSDFTLREAMRIREELRYDGALETLFRQQGEDRA